MILRGSLIPAVILLTLIAPGLGAQQAGPDQDVFRISLAAPTSVKDLQLRVFITGDFGSFSTSTASPVDDNNVVVRTAVETKPAKTFRAIAYAPGCQFVTISVDDLTASDRQGQFHCQQLPTMQFQGRIPMSGFNHQDLQVEVLYEVRWAGKFFHIGSGSLSPFSLAKTGVEVDGSFTLQLPDFSNDPLFSSIASDATLIFSVRDAKTHQHLFLWAPEELATGHFLKVAASYPNPVDFTIQPPGWIETSR